jgi:hypothetical protein
MNMIVWLDQEVYQLSQATPMKILKEKKDEQRYYLNNNGILY